MRSVSRISVAAFAAAVFAAPAAAQPLPPAQQVLDRYAEAIGGREKALSFQSRRLVYQVTSGGMQIEMEAIQRRPNLGVVVMRTGMGEIRSGYDGQTGWMITPMGPQLMEGAQADEVRIRSAFDADVLFNVFDTLETTERAEYAGKACWKVRMVTATGVEATRCFDVQTGLLVALETTQNGMPVTAIHDEYREFDGLKYPSRFTSSAMGQEAVTTLVSVDHSDIPESEFALPEAVRGLRQP